MAWLVPGKRGGGEGEAMELKALFAHAVPYRLQLALVVSLSLLASFASLAVPWLGAQLLGGIIGAAAIDLGLVIAALIGALFLLTGLTIASAVVSSIVSNRIHADFRRDIYAHIQRLPLAFFDRSRQGDLLALMTWEVGHLSNFVSRTLASVPAALVTAAGAVLILFLIDPFLALVVPLLVPGYYVSLKLTGRRLRALATRVQKAEARVFASAEEDLEMLPAVKAFAREDQRLADYASQVEKARSLTTSQDKIYAALGPATSLVTALATIAVLLLAGNNLGAGAMDATELFSFLLYIGLLTRPVASLADLWGQFQTARGILERLQGVLSQPHEPGYREKQKIHDCRGEISFRGVWFSYSGRRGTLRGIDLDIRAGEIVALTGKNGAGKSTIVKLLLGFYAPDAGVISLDGSDISRLDLKELRRQVGHVPQRPLLFNGSVRDNIVFGRENVTWAELEWASDLAQATGFIQDLPSGFMSEIGDHGVRLSGGQRQRLALARALLRDPAILILDEATAMYDLEGEADFVAACRAALLGRTVILITHRPASLELADRILMLEDGRVVEGTRAANGLPERTDPALDGRASAIIGRY